MFSVLKYGCDLCSDIKTKTNFCQVFVYIFDSFISSKRGNEIGTSNFFCLNPQQTTAQFLWTRF